jgi:hypothetical protein
MKQTTSNKKSSNKSEQFLNSGKTHHSIKSKTKIKKTNQQKDFFKTKAWFEFLAK